MCDTVAATPSVTQSGNLLFAKNSDREPDEAQAILWVPAQTHTEKFVQCTYITIPQVRYTYACIFSKPFQMWGAEMGVNEHGVVIGNEAVFTRISFQRNNKGLTGMDMLRLALERSTTAQEATECIINLLQHFGQDACGGYRNKRFFYHNSFLIADAQRAFVLETAGKHWVMDEVKNIRSISNKLTIDGEGDRISKYAKDFALQKGWWNGKKTFRFDEAYSNRLMRWFTGASQRQACTMALLHKETVSVADCMQLLQTHHVPDAKFMPHRATTASVCMHATGILNPSQTTGSMVAEIRATGLHTIWLTGTSNPCLSVYIPFFIPVMQPINVLQPSAMPDNSLWWKAERIHRWVAKDYQNRKANIEAGRQALQKQFLKEEASLLKTAPAPEQLSDFSLQCLHRVMKWLNEISHAALL